MTLAMLTIDCWRVMPADVLHGGAAALAAFTGWAAGAGA